MDEDFEDQLKHVYTRYQEMRPQHYYRNGKPIISTDPAIPAFLIWAMEFETTDRRVAQTKTIYGERLSTVWLGLDHSFQGPPILFETMLFAPESDELRKAKREWLHRVAESFNKAKSIGEREESPEETYIKKHYPHDQLQLRYATEFEASDSHEKLKLQCLIPPRWRHFLLWTIWCDADWSFYGDEEDEWT